MAEAGRIRVGIGGWTFEPWRGVFYPKGLRQADELAFASRHVTSIEINSTYTSTQKPATFAKWAAQAPEDFVFAVKASRFATNRKVLAEAGESVDRFLGQGIVELGDHLGPILWQFMPTKRFDPDDFARFLDLLPEAHGGLRLRHAVEGRHESFADPRFVALCRDRNVAVCVSENEAYPLIPDITADFVYVRMLAGSDDIETGYPAAALDDWADRLRSYSTGNLPSDVSPQDRTGPPTRACDVFAYLIHSGKVRAPAGAQALIRRLG